MTSLEQIDEAIKRLGLVKRELGDCHIQKELLTEEEYLSMPEVFFRIKTLCDMIIILQSDLRSMKEDWIRDMCS